MLSENLKSLRKARGISQEEIANRLNVVRQTISKWEKGLSVPDADLLIRISDIFEVSVSELLGEVLDNGNDIDIVAEQLSRINEQLAINNRRARFIWKIVGITFAITVAINIVLAILSVSIFGRLYVASYKDSERFDMEASDFQVDKAHGGIY